MIAISLQAPPGATSISLARLSNTVVYGVDRSGIGQFKVDGTPGNQQFQYVAATGTLNFDPANPFNDPVVINGRNYFEKIWVWVK